jgi:hypothetical protein
MWAHYTDCHRGLVIGFDEEKVATRDHFYDIQYRFQRNPYHPVQTVKTGREWLIPHLITKSSEWTYEQEVRLLAQWSECIESTGWRFWPFRRRGLHFWPFPREAVQEVIFGSRCSDTARNSVRTILSKTYPHAAISQMRLHDTDFSLVNEPLTTQ